MSKVTQEELDQILADHALWLDDDPIGKRADLSHADLSHADLSHANLSGANFFDAILTGVNLAGVSLSGVNLADAKFGLNIIDAASIYYATFSKDAYEWLIPRDDWAEVKDTLKIVGN